ncbi:MAG: DEAD/DEAH box helicase [Bacillota bacterium]
MENLIFKELELSKEVLKGIEKMGFEEATPIQTQAIGPMLEGRDIIGQAPTGTGKTCAFGIPIIENLDTHNDQIQVLILCPTRELVLQTAEELTSVAHFKHGVRILPIYGGQQIDRQIVGLRKRPHILVATPGRMMDHLRRKTAKIDGLQVIVLDEADEMLNMGFREDIDIILETVPEERQTVLFSATMPKEILDITHKYQKNAVKLKITHKELAIPTIEQYYVEVKGKNKVEILTRLIEHNNYKLSLVFCNTKRMVDELLEVLVSRGYSAEALHGDMRQVQRDKVMNRFRKGAVDLLIATDVAARGIDVDDIEAVFNFDIPSDDEYYVHRIGRTGRANKKGVSYTFATAKDMYKLREIMRYTKATIHRIDAPSAADVMDSKVNSLLQKIRESAEKDNLSKYTYYIKQMLENDEGNELTTVDVAAAFLKAALGGDEVKESVPTESASQVSRETGAEYGMARLFVNVGKKDKIEVRHIIEMIASNSGIDGGSIGAVDIKETFSFVEVPAQDVETVIVALDGIRLKGRTIAIEKATPKSPVDGAQNADRNRGRRPSARSGGERGGRSGGGERSGEKRREFGRSGSGSGAKPGNFPKKKREE